MTALSQLTPVQHEALMATAERHLREPEELAAEWLHLLYIAPSEGRARHTDDADSDVNGALTGTCDLSIPATETFAVSFSTAPPH